MSVPRPAGTPGPAPGRALAALLTLLLSLLPSAASGATAPPAVAEPGADDPAAALTVELVDIAPAVLTPEDDLTVRATVTNGSGREVPEPVVRLSVQRSTPISRSALERWLDPGARSATVVVAVEELPAPIPPGGTTTLTLTVPPADLALGPAYTAWGPRGLEVTVTDGADPAALPALDRSFLLWWPDLEVTPTPVAVLAALVPTAAERTAAREAGTSLADAAAPRLGPLVEALARADLALDPAVLAPAAAQAVPDEPPGQGRTDDPAPVETGPSVAPVATATSVPPEEPTPAGPAPAPPPEGKDAPAGTDLVAAIADHPRLHALPWGDADVAALAHSGAEDLLDSALAATRRTLADAEVDAVPGLAWPAAEQPDRETVEAAAAAGADAVVLPDGAVAVTESLTYTPVGRASVLVGDTALPAVLADRRLSAILAGNHERVTADEDDGPTPLDDLTARQFLLAETAVVARERPSDARALLLALPRDADVDPAALGERLDALATAPWVDVVPVARLLAEDPPDLERAPLPHRVVEAGEIGPAALGTVRRVQDAASAFADVLADPGLFVGPVRTALLGTLSASWRAAPEAREELLTSVAADVATVTSLVATRPGSTLLLINDEAHIPVSVTNDLDQDVRVQVRLEPRDPRLVAEDTVPLEVSANASANVQVPVHAVGSGDVVVDVLLASPSGTPIGPPSEIRVRVRADWENVGTGVVAGVLLVLLVVGLVRTARRNRRGRELAAATGGAP